MYNIVTIQEKGLNLPDLSLIMLGAGSSSRFKLSSKKQWLRTGHTPLWLHATNNITKNINFKKVIVVCSKDELNYIPLFSQDYTFIQGGSSRTESLKKALLHVETSKVLVSDVARVNIPKSMLENIVFNDSDADIIVPYLSVSDTVVYGEDTISRNEVKLIQTPQLSKTKILQEALEIDLEFTDDSSAIKNNNGKIFYIKGDKKARKLTFSDDLEIIKHLQAPSNDTFVGFGLDVHEFEEYKPMYLCGVEIESEVGFKAHSDGDVAIHALIDALLGACGAGDIGELFPNTDMAYKNADSKILLEKVVKFIYSVGFEIVNCDLTIMAEKPNLLKYKMKMRGTIAGLLNLPIVRVNIKATTTEKLGFVGRQEGVCVQAVASLKYYNWEINENTNS